MFIEKSKPFYNINQVAELLGISADRLRTYDEEGLVFPHRQTNKNKRLYSELDIEWLGYCRYFIQRKRINFYSLFLILNLINLIKDENMKNISILNLEELEILKKMKSNPNFKKAVTSLKMGYKNVER